MVVWCVSVSHSRVYKCTYPRVWTEKWVRDV